ncbi:hypothetical protein GQ457_08G027830 [Hibiscus cannabinus]
MKPVHHETTSSPAQEEVPEEVSAAYATPTGMTTVGAADLQHEDLQHEKIKCFNMPLRRMKIEDLNICFSVKLKVLIGTKINAYDMPCDIFVGVDNHGKTILFGCAILCSLCF